MRTRPMPLFVALLSAAVTAAAACSNGGEPLREPFVAGTYWRFDSGRGDHFEGADQDSDPWALAVASRNKDTLFLADATESEIEFYWRFDLHPAPSPSFTWQKYTGTMRWLELGEVARGIGFDRLFGDTLTVTLTRSE